MGAVDTGAVVTPDELAAMGYEPPEALSGATRRRAVVTLAGCSGGAAPDSVRVTCARWMADMVADWLTECSLRNGWGGTVRSDR